MLKCKVCDSTEFAEVLNFKKTVFSDGYTIEKPLIKEECKQCGTIRTKIELNLREFYRNNYNPSRNIDTLAFIDEQTVNRSYFIYNWISSLIEKNDLYSFEKVLEIGCGYGFLLEKFPCKNKYGVEPNEKAYLYAKQIANVRNIGFEDIPNNDKYDFVYSYCVIEHVEDPNLFLEKQYNILNDNGKLLIGLPIQDKFNYDLFFADHIHHFSHQNFIKLLNKCGFSVVNYELGRGSYANIGMYVCKKTNKREEIYFDYIKNINLQNVNIILKNIDNIIEIYKDKPLYAFGYGEIAKTILPYSDLDNYIISYIDDYNRGSKTISTDEAKLLFKDRPNVNIVLLVNPVHMEKVKSLFNGFNNIEFIDIFKGVKGDLE